ncbi:MAG: hypothetical protein Kow0074_19520 [Candidatus Zixiibacteriota bacterium]
MRHYIWRAIAVAAFAFLPSVAGANTIIGSHVGAIQQSMGRTGHEWAVGLTSGGSVSMALNERWRLRFGLEWSRLWNDTTSTALVKFANRTTETSQAWTTTSLRALGEFRPELLENLGSYLSFGVGTASWNVQSYPGYETIDVAQPNGGSKDFAATELLVIGGFGIEPAIASNIHARIGVHADYYSGIGASFPDGFRDNRSHFLVGLTFGLGFRFGSVYKAGSRSGGEHLIIRPAEKPAMQTAAHDDPPIPPGSDPGPDKLAVESQAISPLEYLGPTTGELFASLVPEACRETRHLKIPKEFAIDEEHPVVIDSDGDGISDEIDRCPSTPRGFSVDASGCMKLTAQSEGFVLRVNYASGASEPDSISVLILEDLATRLMDHPEATVLIEGHTDNIGTDLDNLILSQKRATRIKEYLVELGVAPDRINAVGRGEAEPIATNGTSSGRKANRRIEISYGPVSSTSASTE